MGGKRDGKGPGAGTAEKGATKGGKTSKGGAAKGAGSAAGDKGGGRGAGKGKDGPTSKGKGRGAPVSGKGTALDDAVGTVTGPTIPGAKTVQELEAEIFIAKLSAKYAGASDGVRREAAKQPLEAKGAHCEVKKHSEMGCAVVTMESESAREVMMSFMTPKVVKSDDGKQDRVEIKIGEHTVQMRPHVDKETKKEIKSDFFIAWGHKSEKQSPLAASVIADAFDNLWTEAYQAWTSAVQAQMSAGLPNGMGYHPMMPLMMANGAMPLLQRPVGAGGMRPQGMMPAQNYFNMMMLQQQQHQHQAAQAAAMAQQPQHQQQQNTTGGAEAPPTPSTTSTNEMRANAPTFNMFTPQTEVFAGYNEYMYPWVPERKPLKIVDPVSGQPIEVLQAHAQEYDPVKMAGLNAPGRQKLAIIDPTSGKKVDAVGLNFSPPKKERTFTIVDPQSGSAVQV